MEIVVYLLRSHEVKGGNLGCGRLPFMIFMNYHST